MNETSARLMLPAVLALAAAGITQSPAGTKPTAPKDVPLVALRPFLSTKIVRSEPLAAKPDGEAAPKAGTSHDQAVATLRDVIFDQDGAIQFLVVEAAEAKEAGKPASGQQHLLPARDVHWRPEGTVLVTELDAAQIAGLPVHAEQPKKTPAEGQPAAKPRTTFLGSALLDATPSRGAKTERLGMQAPTIWLAPTAQRLAVMTIPMQKDENRLVPWSVVHMTATGETVVLDLGTAAEKVNDAPKAKDAAVPPDAAERAACCKHFGVAPPAWETRAGTDPGATAKK